MIDNSKPVTLTVSMLEKAYLKSKGFDTDNLVIDEKLVASAKHYQCIQKVNASVQVLIEIRKGVPDFEFTFEQRLKKILYGR